MIKTAATNNNLDINNILSKYSYQVPRYTSYPTAPHFSDNITEKDNRKLISDIKPNSSISLYFHIPFCEKMCWYCGCATRITQRYSPVENYIHLLAREIRQVKSLLADNITVSHIHFGGGTPTILSPKDTDYLFKIIRENFTIQDDAEIAIEGDPRNITAEKTKSYKDNGVNRMSFGVQDFDIKVQEAINRVQPFEVVYDAIKNCRDSGIDAINIDLIYGLPFQNLKNFERGVNYALLLKPSRIALFGYAHVPWMKKHMKMIDESALPDTNLRLELFEKATEILLENNYKKIGLDHFVREDDSMYQSYINNKLHRNFQGYTTDSAKNLIGLGITSISQFEDGFMQNLTSIKKYEERLLNKELPTNRGIIISKNDKIQRDIIEKIMCNYEVNLNNVIKDWDISIDNIFQNTELLNDLIKDKVISMDNNIITINKDMYPLVRIVASIFDEYFTASEKRHSSAV